MTTEETPFEIGQSGNFRDGKNVTIIGCGPLVYEALKAAEELAKEGIEAEVVNNHTIKPMDKDTISKIGQKNRLRRHNRRTSGGGRNGFGRQRNFISKLSRADGNHRRQRPLRRIGRTERTLGKIRLDGERYCGSGKKGFEKKIRRK